MGTMNEQGAGPRSRLDVVTYVAADLEVSRVLAGSLDSSSIPLEFLLTSGGASGGAVERMESALPQEDLVVFLHAKRGERETGLYRAVNSLGLWAASERAVLDTPLSEETPDSSVLAHEVAQFESVEALADYVRRVSDHARTIPGSASAVGPVKVRAAILSAAAGLNSSRT